MKMKQLETIQTDLRHAGLSEQIRALCDEARQLEEAGKFEDARLILDEFWPGVGERPTLAGLDETAQAELILRAGTLSGWLGGARQIPGAQEFAKDLLSESATRFDRLGQVERVAEAQVDLGVCYWREGALDEARITLDTALRQLGDIESHQRLRALLNKALIEEVSSRSHEALQILSEAAPLFSASTSHALKGKFHNEFGTVLKNVGLAQRREDLIDRSLMQYTAASVELEEAGHLRALGSVENNLAFLYVHLEKFDEAHEHLDRAVSLVTRSGDKGKRAEFEDTRARAFVGQGLFDKAERVAASAVKRFREGDQQSYLALSLTTHGTVLAKLGRTTEALARFNEAINVAEQAGDRETGGSASITIVEELGSKLTHGELLAHFENAESALSKSQSPAVQFRLGECARKLLRLDAPASEAALPTPAEVLSTGVSLEDLVLHYEADLIKEALDSSGGSITRAARLLGVTHQGLAFILNGRQKNLLSSRKPAKPRRKSIIRFH